MSEMIERVAKILCEQDGYVWSNIEPTRQIAWKQRAIAAVNAMLEPTPEMLEAGCAYTDEGAVYRIWQTMIDSALSRR